MATAPAKQATIYRMVMPGHTCPYGLKAKDLLRRQGYAVDDHWLTTREETDAFKAKHGVKTTPQTFIGAKRVGGYDDLRRFVGKTVRDPKALTYRPVIALFSMTALMAFAVSYAVLGTPFTVRAAEWFIGFSMCVLALLKLQNIESFSSMFLNYDLLAKRAAKAPRNEPRAARRSDAGRGDELVSGSASAHRFKKAMRSQRRKAR